MSAVSILLLFVYIDLYKDGKFKDGSNLNKLGDHLEHSKLHKKYNKYVNQMYRNIYRDEVYIITNLKIIHYNYGDYRKNNALFDYIIIDGDSGQYSCSYLTIEINSGILQPLGSYTGSIGKVKSHLPPWLY
jgi:hypothetical protein